MFIMEEKNKKDIEPDLEKDTKINNRFTIIRKIGQGNFSKVYLTRDKNDEKEYAAKIPLNSASQEEIDNFLNEIKILKILNEENINNNYVTIYHDSGKFEVSDIKDDKKISENRHYLITNYLSKGNLYTYLQKTQNGFNEKHTKIIFHKILEGVQFIHNSGICHLDIKLQNILLDEHYNPIITDFGLSKIMEKSDENEYKMIQNKKGVGTPCYMCPQMWFGRNYYGIKADIFSLGVVLFFLASKKTLFEFAYSTDSTYKLLIYKNKPDEFIQKILVNHPQISEVSKDIRDLYIRMIQYNEKKRPKAVKEILEGPLFDDLKNYKDEDYIEYENMMKDLEKEVVKDNETIESKKANGEKNETNLGNKSAKDNEEIFFVSNLRPKYLEISGLNAMNYIKIKGELNPVKFMNSLANKLLIELQCEIVPNNKQLKFEAKFPNKIKEELENEEEIEDEEEKENRFIKNYEFKDCVIKIKLYEFINGGYEVHFTKIKGDFMDYYSYFQEIKKIIKAILN